ncbi:hypothetical protein KDM87_12670 [Undibacterium sp. FT147W]|uniref:Uncharacterized protein n=1 Tax=Undibacterium rivi TaxID=2828729 RepID=A0ABS5H4K1_9BURK|nr:hypothetical protein [Undibacterium rivi]MBR7793452.1 hypothetical protein [Undibacterium rivi]
MMFSPVLPGHKILGGSFQTYYPMQDRVGKKHNIWEWNLGGEEAVLREIFQLFQQEWRSIEAKDQAGSLMLAGIGISHSDVPALLARLSSSSIASQDRIYDLLCGCRQIDLSTATYCQFSFNQAYFSYPKTKSALYQKYLNGKKLESGKSVWDMYESKDFSSIESRCSEETDDALAIYKAMFDIKKKNDRSIARLKKLDKMSEAQAPVASEI